LTLSLEPIPGPDEVLVHTGLTSRLLVLVIPLRAQQRAVFGVLERQIGIVLAADR